MSDVAGVRRVGVIFGGRSVEHEVSVITAHQGMDALKVAGFEILPIYIAKTGHWYAGEGLYDLRAYADLSRDFAEAPGVFRVSLSPDRGIRRLIADPARGGFFHRTPPLWADVFFPMIHGSFGEDGTLAGLLEMADVPYVGADVLASAIGMNKAMTKHVARAHDVPVLECLVLERAALQADPAAARARIAAFAPLPVMVKPVHLGSSIGVRRCRTEDELTEALAAAATLDSHVLVERALADFFEVNCAVLGPPEEVSVCEQPTTDATLLSFDEKYRRGAGTSKGKVSAGMASLGRIIPAPIPHELTREVQRLALAVFRAIGASGVARVDFLYDRAASRLYFNEINTIPGSLAFYLWEATGLPFDQLVSRLVGTALARARARSETVFSFDANLLGRSR
jgi:D-alanine-D-alanine ligase